MLVGDAEHLADHGHRKPESEVGDEIHVTARLDAIDDLIDNLLNARAHVLDPLGGKGPYHQTPQAPMIGRILLQHPAAHAAIDRLLENLRPVAPGHAADEILAEAFVAKDRGNIGVPARDVEAAR